MIASIFALPLLLAAIAGAPPGGAQLYTTACATCHAANAGGTTNGPSLRGVGAATLDFYLSTGRMPAAVPDVQVGHRDVSDGNGLAQPEIAALEAYLAPTVAGGPAIPRVPAHGDVVSGEALYQQNCQQCHAVGGVGGSLSRSNFAPALDRATPAQIGDAVRAGPGQMPRFSEAQLSATAIGDLAAYVLSLRHASAGPPAASTGPVPEGATGYLAIIALVVFVFVFWRVDTPARSREETVRRDEGEHVP